MAARYLNTQFTHLGTRQTDNVFSLQFDFSRILYVLYAGETAVIYHVYKNREMYLHEKSKDLLRNTNAGAPSVLTFKLTSVVAAPKSSCSE